MDVGSNFLGSSSPSLVSLSFSLSVQTPSAAQTANRGRKKRAKTFLPSSSLARPQFVRPSALLSSSQTTTTTMTKAEEAAAAATTHFDASQLSFAEGKSEAFLPSSL